MPLIIPIKDLRNTSEISDMAHKVQEPIFITKNGYSDLVVMSIEAFERREEIWRLRAKLAAAEQARVSGQPAISMEESRSRLEAIYGQQA